MYKIINFQKARMTLKQAVSETFNKMAFICVTESNYKHVIFKNRIKIDFSYPFTGGIILFFMDDLKKRIVEKIYGKKWIKLSTDIKDDCMVELINAVARNFLSFYFSDEFDKKEFYASIKETNSCYIISIFFNAGELKFKTAVFTD